jgi:NAD(P)-dependent dehydrogenase (short-subunit alcohol dehydrogenase family)
VSAATLAGRHALVTGGAAGIGLATARSLARAGAAVSLLDLRAADAREAARALAAETGASVRGFGCDVAKEPSVRQAFAGAVGALGSVTVLVNNAGIMAPRVDASHRIPAADFDRMVAVHLRGAFLATQQVVDGMRAARFGRIVNLSSVFGLVGLPYRVAYQVAKTGIIGLTRTVALENARHGITCNAVAPGYVLTDTLLERVRAGLLDHDRYAERTPAGRWGRPEEVARVIAFLCEPDSAYITGTTVSVDGGFAIRGDPGEDIGPREDGPVRPRAAATRRARSPATKGPA